MCPVGSGNRHVIGGSRGPGPMTKRITQAKVECVGADFVAQYLSRLT